MRTPFPGGDSATSPLGNELANESPPELAEQLGPGQIRNILQSQKPSPPGTPFCFKLKVPRGSYGRPCVSGTL
jgi:hypothetical protein